MDHYCPFVLNTIGFNNHGMFFLLCLYHTLGILIGLTGFFLWVYNDFWAFIKEQSFFVKLAFPAFLMMDLAAVMSLMGFTAYMFGYNVDFVVRNITTLDWLKERGKSTIQADNLKQNVRSLYDFGFLYNLGQFGLRDCLFWFPRCYNDPFEGYYFPRHDRKGESLNISRSKKVVVNQADGSQSELNSIHEIKAKALEVNKGFTLLYPSNMQVLCD